MTQLREQVEYIVERGTTAYADHDLAQRLDGAVWRRNRAELVKMKIGGALCVRQRKGGM